MRRTSRLRSVFVHGAPLATLAAAALGLAWLVLVTEPDDDHAPGPRAGAGVAGVVAAEARPGKASPPRPSPARRAPAPAPASGDRGPAPGAGASRAPALPVGATEPEATTAQTRARYGPAVVREVEAQAAAIERLLAPDTEELVLVRRLRALVRARLDPSPAPPQPPGASLAPAEAIAALAANHPSDEARRQLVALLHAIEPDTRALAVRALARWSDAAGDLAVLLEREPEEEVRRAIIRALGERGGDAALLTLATWARRAEAPRTERDAAAHAARRLAARTGLPTPPGLPLTRRQESRAAVAAAAPGRRQLPAPERRSRRERR